MKLLITQPATRTLVALCLWLALLANTAKGQVTNYFDVNGSTDGSGVVDGGSYNWEDMNWTTDLTGNSATVNWVEGNVPAFSAGSDATGAYTITANNNHIVAGVQAPTGAVTINGPGILTNASGMQLFTGTNLTINAVLAGTGGFESATNNDVYLYGDNTFSGGCVLNGGSTYINSASSLGTGTISPILGGASPVFSALFSPVNTITLTNPLSITTADAGIVFVPSTTTPLTLSGNIDVEQDFYCRNNGPGSFANPPSAVTGVLTISGTISGPGGMILSCNGDNLSTIALTGANTYTGKTICDPNGGTRIYINFTTAQPIGSGIPNSLGEPPDAATGQIDIGHPYNATTGFADALRYVGSTDSTTDRTINNANGDPADGGMYLYADGTGAITYSGNITAAAASVARTLTLQGSSTALNTISGTISDGTGGGVINVIKESPATWRLLGNNTFTGSLTVQNTTGLGGTSTLLLGGSNLYLGATTISANSLLQLAGPNPIPHGPGYGKFAINTGGTFELAGFDCSVDGGGGAGTIDNNTGTATLTIDNNIANTGPTFSGPVQETSPGVLNFAANCGGVCQLTYSGGNSYSGYTAVSNAIVQITADNQLGLTPASVCATNIILDSNLGWNGTANTGNWYLRRQGSSGSTDLNANRGIYLGNAAGYGGGIGAQSGGTLNVRGPISGPGGLWIGGGTAHAGTGTIVLYNTGNTYSGGTYVVGGTLRLGDNNVLPTGTPLTISDSQTVTFAMNSKSQTIGPLTGVNTGATINLNGALTIIENAPTTFAGVISQSGGSLILDASSTSTLTLTGVNTFSGTTVINGGTLALSGSGAIGSSASITVGRGGTFDVSGVNTALTLGASQTLAAGGTGGTSATIATASGFGVTLGASSPLNFTAYDGTTVPLTVTGAGSLAIAPGNPVTVTTTTPLNTGSYKLVQMGAGNTTAVTGTPASAVTVNGSGLAGGRFATLAVTGGELYLNVQKLQPVSSMSIAPAGGGNLTISYSGGAGAQFVLLQTNNVAAPLINWTPLQTNTLSTGSFTITPGADPAEFYRIQSE